MKSSLRKLLPFFFFFLFFNYVLSPSIAEISPVSEESAFLKEQPIKTLRVLTITGYSSSYDETDDTPWITAYNTLARDGVVASNILPFGTKLKIPSLFGDKIFIVEDKMHPRYGENLDIWFPTKWEAQQFGIHYNVLVEILE